MGAVGSGHDELFVAAAGCSTMDIAGVSICIGVVVAIAYIQRDNTRHVAVANNCRRRLDSRRLSTRVS